MARGLLGLFGFVWLYFASEVRLLGPYIAAESKTKQEHLTKLECNSNICEIVFVHLFQLCSVRGLLNNFLKAFETPVKGLLDALEGL